MADESKEVEGSSSRGNEWEVVSLTASAYAAVPGPGTVESTEENKDKEFPRHDTDPSMALFMSDHFVFPPCEHENLPLIERHAASELEPQHVGSMVGDSGYDDKEPFNAKSLSEHAELLGIENFDKGKKIWFPEVEFSGKVLDDQKVVETADSCYGTVDVSKVAIFDEIGDDTEPGSISSESEYLSELSRLVNSVKENSYSVSPYESWWRKHVVSLYTHAKEANKFWSVFVAAALMGLLILGQRWQQERWHIQQLKWNLSGHDKIVHRVLGPVSRFKDVLIGNHRRGLGGISMMDL